MNATDTPSGLTLKRGPMGFGKALFVVFMIATVLGGIVASGGTRCTWMGCSTALENFITGTLLFFLLGGLFVLAFFVMEDTSARYMCDSCGSLRTHEEIQKDRANPRILHCSTCFIAQ